MSLPLTDSRPQSSMSLPADYTERVYAGILGKLIGVYLGRPFEGWSHERIVQELGEVDHYVHERFNMPLVVTDDDVTGTFTFLRALEDHGYDPGLTPRQIGEAWLNYTIERRTIFWWGGFGTSTEHTAYLRLKNGIHAPESGSIARNTKVVAEQIGSQIFIDGWAMIAPGDPELAADFARRAASVSHDGEAIYGAQVIAAIEAAAFVESDINKLIDTAVALIPADSDIARLIHDVREWHAAEDDWYKTRALIGANYGYDKFRGNCHMVPNHALIIHALLHGNDDFRRSLMIVNTGGWDTDCNSGNVGNILGIKNGMATFAGADDLRFPVEDRLYLSTAEGGRGISDAAIETIRVVNAGRALKGEAPIAPKEGARFHFSLPGSVQGFRVDAHDPATVVNVAQSNGDRVLAITLTGSGTATVTTPTFIPEEAINMKGYALYASPTLFPGQQVDAVIAAGDTNGHPITAALVLRFYGADDKLVTVEGPGQTIQASQSATLTWDIPDTAGAPIAQIGLRAGGSDGDFVLLDRLGWSGEPAVTLGRPAHGGDLWRRAWVDGVDQWEARWWHDYHIVQNHGTGLIMQGTEEWRDITVTAPVTISLANAAGVAVRVGGLRRYYALVLAEGGLARIVKAQDGETVLAEVPFAWETEQEYSLSLSVTGTTLTGSIDGKTIISATDDSATPLRGGGIGLLIAEGTLTSGPVTVA